MNLQADLLVLLPELILAVGAMALLLLGAINGEKSAPAVSWGAIALLAAAGVATVMGPDMSPPSMAPSSPTAFRASPRS